MLSPSIVRIRRSNLTYGVGVLIPFDKTKHRDSKKVIIDKQEWCKDVFHKFLEQNECIFINETITRRYATINKFDQHQINIFLYSAELDCEFVSDNGVTKCGSIVLYLNEPNYLDKIEADITNKQREIQIKMTFGETEIRVSAVDVLTGECVKASFEFFEK
jgi:hypothetical protein